LANALKYALGLSVVMLTAFTFNDKYEKFDYETHPHSYVLYVFLYVTAATYAWCWDMFMDWTMFEFKRVDAGNTSRRKCCCSFRKMRMFPVWLYYLCAVADFFLRFVWVSNLTVSRNFLTGLPFAATFSIYFGPVAGALELTRRGMWGVLRVENAYCKQCPSDKWEVMPSYVRPPSKKAKNPLEKGGKDHAKDKSIHWIGAVILVVTVLGMVAAIVVHFALADADEEKLATS